MRKMHARARSFVIGAVSAIGLAFLLAIVVTSGAFTPDAVPEMRFAAADSAPPPSPGQSVEAADLGSQREDARDAPERAAASDGLTARDRAKLAAADRAQQAHREPPPRGQASRLPDEARSAAARTASRVAPAAYELVHDAADGLDHRRVLAFDAGKDRLIIIRSAEAMVDAPYTVRIAAGAVQPTHRGGLDYAITTQANGYQAHVAMPDGSLLNVSLTGPGLRGPIPDMDEAAFESLLLMLAEALAEL
jgi:hypothetical protein